MKLNDTEAGSVENDMIYEDPEIGNTRSKLNMEIPVVETLGTQT